MQRMVARQVLFLSLLIVALLLVMGMVFVTTLEAKTLRLHGLSDWEWDWEDDWYEGSRIDPVFRYNRVEGIYTGMRVNKDYWRYRYPSGTFLFGFSGYAFHAKELEYQIGLEKGFFHDNRLAFGAEYHRMVDTPDRWIMPELENSLAAFFLKKDYHDFYLREGASAYVEQRFGRRWALSVTYHQDKLDSLQKEVDWALFGGKSRFRDNPPMDAGDLHTMVGRLVFDTRNSERRTTRGWYIQLEAEHAGNELKGDFTFDRLLVDIRRYQPLGFGEGIDLRIRAGTAHGQLPWQRSFHLGGISTLRGFPYKAYPDGRQNPGGNRMVLAQVEYRMGESEIPDALGLWIIDFFNFILFFDAGWVMDVGPDAALFQGFDELSWSSLKTDVGIALANRSGSIRVEVARRLDTGHKPFTFVFRINRSF